MGDYAESDLWRRREEGLKRDKAAAREIARLEKRAEKAEEDGDHAKADMLFEKAASVMPQLPLSEVPKVRGIAQRKDVTVTVIDKEKLKPGFLIADQKALEALAKKFDDPKLFLETVGEGSCRIQTKTSFAISGK